MPSIKQLLLAAMVASMAAAACDEDVTIESNGDVSQLASCSKLNGKVTLGKKVTSVALPATLTSITGDVVADGAADLVAFQAPGLRTIGGSFTLKGLIVLNNLAFPELVSVGDINWATLPALQTLGFTKEVSKANSVLITDTLLNTLQGINLKTAERFNINNNRYLRSVDVALTQVSDLLLIESNGKGVNASFPDLKWANNITVRDAGDIYFPKLEKVNSSAAFVNNTFTTADFPELTAVGESFALISCSKLEKITANSLETVGGTFQLANNTKLTNVDGFGALRVVGGAIDLSGTFKDVNLPKLDDVRGGFNLQSTDDVNCGNFTSLKSAGVVKGDDFTCEGKKERAESKTAGLGTDGSGHGSTSGAVRIGASFATALLAGAVAMFAL
ncbi:hypothetical protein BZA77DRAFT_119970 [Pyronema omphalodes]|nr:hypothetical protein BZA77DRAFT_119970 [Pyronema omphalodes]